MDLSMRQNYQMQMDLAEFADSVGWSIAVIGMFEPRAETMEKFDGSSDMVMFETMETSADMTAEKAVAKKVYNLNRNRYSETPCQTEPNHHLLHSHETLVKRVAFVPV